MGSRAKRTDPDLWERIKADVTDGDKGGQAGQWSARKAQLAVQEYKQQGGGYAGEKAEDNALARWTREDWGTRSGQRSRDTGERYLPKQAREGLSEAEYARTSDKKRADSRRGRQFSKQPDDIASKTAADRAPGAGGSDAAGASRADLYREAQARNIPGRSRMRKEELQRALAEAGATS